jgi:hypothetical protein
MTEYRNPRQSMRRNAIALSAVVALMLAGEPGSPLGVAGAQTSNRASPPDELEITATSLRHRRYGFTARFPVVGFRVDTALQQRMDSALAGQEGVRIWILTNPEVEGALMVQASASKAISERNFREYAAGFRSGLTRSGRHPVLSDTIVWSPSGPELQIETVQAGVLHQRARCVATAAGREPAFVACVSTLTGKEDTLAMFRSSLTIEATP